LRLSGDDIGEADTEEEDIKAKHGWRGCKPAMVPYRAAAVAGAEGAAGDTRQPQAGNAGRVSADDPTYRADDTRERYLAQRRKGAEKKREEEKKRRRREAQWEH
jgi:hypothetical protein